MSISKFMVWTVAVMAIGAYGLSLASAQAEEGASGTQATTPQPVTPGEASPSPPPRSPIRIDTIDFQDAQSGPGKLKLTGTAAPGTTVYIFIDLDPYAKVLADGDGKWSLEGDLELTQDQHRLRAEQYDPVTRMLSGRAMITIGRNKVNAEP
ncbi:MAG: hypothetical protein ACOYB4_04745 [Methyloceanibacter sp.]